MYTKTCMANGEREREREREREGGKKGEREKGKEGRERVRKGGRKIQKLQERREPVTKNNKQNSKTQWSPNKHSVDNTRILVVFPEQSHKNTVKHNQGTHTDRGGNQTREITKRHSHSKHKG